MSTPGFSWTEDALAVLDRLVNEGLSARQIGDILGLTRNSVLGKLYRMGRTTKIRSTHNGKPRSTPELRRKPREQGIGSEPTDLESEATENPTSIFDLQPDQCRWPVEGQGYQTLFCGGAVHGRHSYCWPHCCRAFNHRPRLTRAELEIHSRKFRSLKQSGAVSDRRRGTDG